MRTLALDTATPATTVAVSDGRDGWLEARDDPAPGARPGHARLLLPLAADLLVQAGWEWATLQRIVVGRGPGTFTGLRIGIATARGLAGSLKIPLAGVSTLQSLALGGALQPPGPDAGRPRIVLAALDARRREVFAAAWSAGPGGLAEEVLAAAAMPPTRLAEWIASAPVAPQTLGDGAVAFRSVLEPAGALIPADGSTLHRVSAVNHLRVAGERVGGPPESVIPAYLRLPDAEITRRAANSDGT
jgi:tRNA threonylcarbamoyladenosine biosynthesis protein TsaB